MPKLPQVSSDALLRLLTSLGYRVVRQKGSHAQLTASTAAGKHRITVPIHRTIAKGTLNDILSQVSLRTGIRKDELVRRLH